MSITFRQLTVFLAVAEHKSITAAANACHVTQPTVSMQMKELSEVVGLPLYEQIGKRLYLTAAGEAVADTARVMADEWARLQQTIDAMKGHRTGRLRIAVVTTAQYFVPRMLGGFCQAYPEVDISLAVLNRDGVVQRLRQNVDDLYIMSTPPDDMALEQHVFLDNPLVLIAPLSHPLVRKRKLNFSNIAQEPFILREPGSGTRLACNAHFDAHRFEPKVRLELGSNEAIKQAVAGGLGLAVISRHALAAAHEDEGLAVLSHDSFPIHSSWWILYPRGKRLSPVASEFMAHLDATALRSGREKSATRI
jgi:LysR family transcriptional regulator, low CO2-responsive transcriptional regulator